MWKVGGIKIERTQPRNFFLQTDEEISEKRNIFVNSSVTEFFLGHLPSESLRTQDSEYLYERGVETFCVLPPRGWEMPLERIS